jgi:aryl-alcohol dehydrogenase-like predicted oxidoreductase
LLTGRSAVTSSVSTRAENQEYARQMYDDALDVPVAKRCAWNAAQRGMPSARIALAWLLHQPAVVAPIIGASKAAHLEDAVAAVSVTLSAEERAALEEPYRPHRVLGHK